MTSERVRAELPGVLSSPGAARTLVRDALRAWGLSGLEDTALLLASELATNAVLHARSTFLLEVRRTGTGVRIAVSDTAAGSPAARHYALQSSNGRGLAMVEQLATGWGTDAGTGVYAKTVWFELRA